MSPKPVGGSAGREDSANAIFRVVRIEKVGLAKLRIRGRDPVDSRIGNYAQMNTDDRDCRRDVQPVGYAERGDAGVLVDVQGDRIPCGDQRLVRILRLFAARSNTTGRFSRSLPSILSNLKY